MTFSDYRIYSPSYTFSSYLVISRLDYCCSLLHGFPSCAASPLQIIQNSVAHLLYNIPIIPKKTHSFCLCILVLSYTPSSSGSSTSSRLACYSLKSKYACNARSHCFLCVSSSLPLHFEYVSLPSSKA